MIRLTPRQQKIAAYIPKCACVADIGCDHGRLGAYLLQSGKCKKVIACDISAPSLEKARMLAVRLGLEGCETRLADGMLGLKENEADCAVIAGMGGLTIANILKAAVYKPEIIIAQPMNGVTLLKQTLPELGYMLLDECIAAEGRRMYQVQLLGRGLSELSEIELLLPMKAIVRQDDECRAFIDSRISLFSAQRGKCALSGELFENAADIVCWLKTPAEFGGRERYQNTN